jgi:hypothetical protein
MIVSKNNLAKVTVIMKNVIFIPRFFMALLFVALTFIALAVITQARATVTSYADVDFVPLDMELGYWETTTQLGHSEAIRNILAGMPESQRVNFLEMLKSKTQVSVVKQCISSETRNNIDQKIIGSMAGSKNCDFKLIKSTSQQFTAELNCAGQPTFIQTKVINSKRQDTVVIKSMGAMEQNTITTIAQWKSPVCPADVTP